MFTAIVTSLLRENLDADAAFAATALVERIRTFNRRWQMYRQQSHSLSFPILFFYSFCFSFFFFSPILHFHHPSPSHNYCYHFMDYNWSVCSVNSCRSSTLIIFQFKLIVRSSTNLWRVCYSWIISTLLVSEHLAHLLVLN